MDEWDTEDSQPHRNGRRVYPVNPHQYIVEDRLRPHRTKSYRHASSRPRKGRSKDGGVKVRRDSESPSRGDRSHERRRLAEQSEHLIDNAAVETYRPLDRSTSRRRQPAVSSSKQAPDPLGFQTIVIGDVEIKTGPPKPPPPAPEVPKPNKRDSYRPSSFFTMPPPVVMGRGRESDASTLGNLDAADYDRKASRRSLALSSSPHNTTENNFHDGVPLRRGGGDLQRVPSAEANPNPTWMAVPPTLQHRNSSSRTLPIETQASSHQSDYNNLARMSQLHISNPLRSSQQQGLETPLSTRESLQMPPESLRPDESMSDTLSIAGYRQSMALSGPTRMPKPQRWSSSSSGILGVKGYQYSALGESQFRLVKILRQTMSTIKCEIDHYWLDDPPPYIAISYAWGDADDTEKIVLQGSVIPITHSLYGALQALREKKRDILVWADALCIDQQNKEERMQQISLMTSIYATASSVAVWLGPEDENSDLGISLLEDIAAKSAVAKSPDEMTKFITSRSDGPGFPAVVSLFEREYWSRLWVVQEVFNATNIVVYCGSTKVSWETYKEASNTFQDHHADLNRLFPSNRKHGDQRSSQSQFSFSQVLSFRGPSSLPDVGMLMKLNNPLFEVMRACREKLTADSRDKLFGILGILPVEVRKEFNVDYSLSVKEVYITVADYLITMQDRLDIICESIHFPVFSSSTSVPTWVPDWSNITTMTAMGRSFQFDASKGEPEARFKLLDKRRKLEISAIFLDTISEHGIGVGTLCTLADYLMAFLHWRAVLLGSGRQIPDAEERFCETLCLGQILPGWDRKRWRTACYHVFSALIRERLPQMRLDHDLRSFEDVQGLMEPVDRRQFLQQHFGNRMFGRCFCLTATGLMGMGSGFMSAGDVVVLPLGCWTPIILRPEGNGEFRFVGDVFIHDYMYGRAVEELHMRERQLGKYVLH